VVVKEVTAIIFFTIVIHLVPHLLGEHMLDKMQKALIEVMTSLAKLNNLRVPRIEGNRGLHTGVRECVQLEFKSS
jgi:hypothetical protein